MQTNIGTLTCTLAETGDHVESPPSQTRAMLCGFKPSGTGPEEHYTGEIKNVGSDTALSGKLVLIWVVMGPEHITFAPGCSRRPIRARARVRGPERRQRPPMMLVGETDDTYALRPLSEDEGETVVAAPTT